TIYLQNIESAAVLNDVWDAWVPEGHAPVRLCVEAGLAPGYLVEMAVTAAGGRERGGFVSPCGDAVEHLGGCVLRSITRLCPQRRVMSTKHSHPEADFT